VNLFLIFISLIFLLLLIKNWIFNRISTLIIQGVSGRIVNILGGGSMDYSE